MKWGENFENTPLWSFLSEHGAETKVVSQPVKNDPGGPFTSS